jgi:hypothetical protein|tara:strand:- start:25 stop:243 length:219 start_codon:yes stop_codon:yes gene_type:complete
MIDKLTKDIINKLNIELKKEENKKIIRDQIINPILSEITDAIYPYINMLFFMYSLILILIIIILILIILKKK